MEREGIIKFIEEGSGKSGRLVMDRDINASLNILRAGIALGREMGLPISLKPEAARSLA